jgi:hypothetical protein
MTSDDTSFPERLTKIDELTGGDHSYLQDGDECLFFGDYSARKGFAHSPTNNLILNFKKPVKYRNTPSWRYKTRAISQVAGMFSKNLGADLGKITLVPVPPSKMKGDPEYDDRLMSMLKLVKGSGNAKTDVRELIRQTQGMPAAHDSDNRPPPGEWEEIYEVDENLTNPTPTWIGIVDDLLVTGSRFRAISNVLKSRFPQARITGLFVARRVPEAVDWSEFEDL